MRTPSCMTKVLLKNPNVDEVDVDISDDVNDVDKVADVDDVKGVGGVM